MAMTQIIRGALLALLLTATHAVAQPITALWYQSEAGALNGGQTHLYQAPTDTFLLAMNSPSEVIVAVNPTGADRAQLRIAPRPGDSLAAGAYESAARAPFQGTSPGLDFDTTFGCNKVTGRFVVLEVTYDSEMKIASLAVDFEHHCEGAAPALYGELRINSVIPLSISKAPGTTTPDPFAFLPQALMPLSTTVVSNTTTIYGTNAASPIGIAGGEYSINGSAFTSSPGMVSNRDHVSVRLMSAASGGSTVGATVTVGGVSSTFNVTTYLAGQVFSALYYRMAGQTFYGYPSYLTLAPARTADNQVQVQMQGPLGAQYTLDIAAAAQNPLITGPYEEAARATFRGHSPGLDIYGNTVNCDAPGRFVVLDLEFGAGTTVNRLAANFEAWCGSVPLFGEIRHNSTVPLTFLETGSDSLPDPFALQAQSPVKAGAIVNSNWITIYGVNAPVPISITGGEYSLNGAPFTANPGTAHELDDIIVRLHASTAPGALNQATLNAGGRTATLSATTYQPGMALSGIYYRSPLGDYIGQGQTRIFLTPLNGITAARNDYNGVTIHLDGTAGILMTLNLAAGGNATLLPGAYEGAVRYPFQYITPGGVPGLDFSGDGRGCNEVAGRFVVRQAAYNQDGSVASFAADFEQRCETSEPALVGEARYNSTVPFSSLMTVVRTDLNGDARSDLLYRNATTGQVYRILMNGFATIGAAPAYAEPNTAWKIVADADFNGDGITDLLYRNDATGQVFVLLFNSSGMPGGGGFVYTEPNLDWKIVHTPDIDGDGKADVLWWNAATGQVYAMLMNGAAIAAQGFVYSEPNTAWKIVAAGDFSGSGRKNQLLWRNSGTGQVYLMTVTYSAGLFSQIGQMIYQEPNLAWKIVAAADFNGDGKSDIVWRNDSTGQVYMMLMNGPSIANQNLIYQEPNLAWKIVALGDYDGDGKADLLWRNDSTGQVWMIKMDGLTTGSQGMVYVEPNTNWKVLGPWEYGQ
jgi:hypothetical protein